MLRTAKPVYMTQKGILKAQTELETLINVRRPEIVEYLQDARDDGDKIDNTEYLYLLQELESIDGRIQDLEYKLDNVQLIERIEINEAVSLGSTVIIQEGDASPETYTIVGPMEADPAQGCISYESPLGRALMDHTIGEAVVVDTPDGQLLFRIIGIT